MGDNLELYLAFRPGVNRRTKRLRIPPSTRRN